MAGTWKLDYCADLVVHARSLDLGVCACRRDANFLRVFLQRRRPTLLRLRLSRVPLSPLPRHHRDFARVVGFPVQWKHELCRASTLAFLKCDCLASVAFVGVRGSTGVRDVAPMNLDGDFSSEGDTIFPHLESSFSVFELRSALKVDGTPLLIVSDHLGPVLLQARQLQMVP